MKTFLLRFAVVYLLLIVPWPAWKNTYASGYRSFGNTLFGGDSGQRYLRFEPNTEKGWPPNFDTLIILINRDQLDAQGTGPQIRLGLDTRQMGWIPTALFLALAIAWPLNWRRRAAVLGWGLLLVSGYLGFSLWIYIWNESTRLSLVTLSPLAKKIAENIETIVIANPVGANLLVPVVIFLLVAMRRKDERLLVSAR